LKTLTRLDSALRFWQSRYDTIALELDHLLQRHRALQTARDERSRETRQRHEETVTARSTVGNSLLALHAHLTAHSRYDTRTSVQQQAVATQIEEKRSQLTALRRKLKQVETIRDRAEETRESEMRRKVEEEAAYLFLIREQRAEG
jgi:hypothetical protein